MIRRVLYSENEINELALKLSRDSGGRDTGEDAASPAQVEVPYS